ncbi:MAG: hypothetical protein ACYTXH_35930, partial [Nostoc sp.]
YELPRFLPSVRCINIDFYGDLGLPGEVCYPLNMESPFGINPLVIDLAPKAGGHHCKRSQSQPCTIPKSFL